MFYVYRKLTFYLNRTESDRRQLIDGAGVIGKCLLFTAFFFVILVSYLPPLLSQSKDWLTLRSEVPLATTGPESWKVYYPDSSRDDCDALGHLGATCPANPGFSPLWDSEFFRSDQAHEKRLAENTRTNVYWLGITLAPATLQKARKMMAGRFSAGHILAPYQLWIDGELALSSPGATDPTPLFFSLTEKQLASDVPLHIAFRIFNDGKHRPPDHYCNGIEPGLYTPQSANSFMTLSSVWDRVRPFTLLTCYALVAALFFFFWFPSPQKQEYFFLALFCLSLAAQQAQSTDFLRWQNAWLSDDVFGPVLHAWTAGFGLLIACSFARLRSIIFRVGLPVVILLPPFVTGVLVRDDVARMEIRNWIRHIGLPLAFLLGALVCFGQAAFLNSMAHRHARIPVRVRRLLLFGLGMLGLCILYALQAHSGDGRFFWRGFEQFVVIIFFSATALREYGEQEVRLKKSSVSEYHRRPVLPESVRGVVLVSDLKNSELFYKQRAVQNGEDAVSIWRAHFYTQVLRHQGIILQKKGDEITAFFPYERCPSPWLSAIQTADEIQSDSLLLSRRFADEGHLPEGSEGFFFRAAICEGELRPIWERMGTQREAHWDEAGNSTPLVEAARLMELERKVPGTGSETSLLMVSEADVSALRKAFPKFVARVSEERLEISDKHGVVRSVCAVKLGVKVEADITADLWTAKIADA